MAASLTVRPVARTALDVISARTWLTTIYLMTGVVVGAVIFAVTIAGLVLSVVLMPLFRLGAPLLRRVLRLSEWVAGLERRRVQLMLGQDLPGAMPEPGPGAWWRRGSALNDTAAWRRVGFLLLRLPVGIIGFTVAAYGWALALLLVTLPV